MKQICNRYFFLYMLLIMNVTTAELVAEGAEAFTDEIQTAQAIAEEFRGRLEIQGEVAVRIVDRDKKLVSVRRSPDQKNVFLLSFDQDFLSALSPDELRAAIAHEFGHIWIFTHHPYLHTEALANRTAMLLVSRESLEKVYAKVTQFGGTKQELTSR